MRPAWLELEAFDGATYRRSFQLLDGYGDDASPQDLEGHTFELALGSDDLTTSDADPRLTLDGPTGTVALYLTPADTHRLAGPPVLYRLDLVSPDGDVDPILHGKLRVRS